MIKRIETINNDFLEQLNTMLQETFPKAMSFNIDYFIGEEKGTRGIYMQIISKTSGMLYNRKHILKPDEFVSDVEDEVINKTLNDLVLAGISFLNIEALTKDAERDLNESIKAVPFKNKIPTLVISLN